MKLSRYVLLVNDDQRHVVLYHTRSGVLLRIPADTYHRLAETPMGQEPGADPDLFPLVRRRFLVPDSLAEEATFFDQYERFANRGGSDLSFTIAPTTACNYRCRYCFEQGAKPLSMSNEDVSELGDFIERTARRLQGLKTLSVKWFGGEPLLAWPLILSLSKRLRSFCDSSGLVLRTRVISNGALLTKEMAQELATFGLVNMQVTLDGMEEESCRYKGSTPQSYRHVRKLLSALCTSVHLTLRLNIGPENFASVVALADELHADPLTRENVSLYLGAIDSPYVPSYDDQGFSEAFLAFYRHLFELGWYGPIREAMPEQKKGPCYLLHERGYLIDPTGRILSCENCVGGALGVLGTIADDPGVVLAEKDRLRRAFEASIPATCKSCSFFPLCFTGCPSMRRAPTQCDGFRKRTIGLLRLVERTEAQGSKA